METLLGLPDSQRGKRPNRSPKNGQITQKKTFSCSQTVKSNMLLSQNAGNAISETLDIQNFPGGGMPPDPPSRARASPSADCYAVDHPLFSKTWIRPCCITVSLHPIHQQGLFLYSKVETWLSLGLRRSLVEEKSL